MQSELQSHAADSNLPTGELAAPGIYVVAHCDPPHREPHEILIEKEIILPACHLCLDVRFSFKSPIPPRLEHTGSFRMEMDVEAMFESTTRLVADSRRLLDRRNGH
jgi:hypothetical protein